ncbi:hypothetical protein [Actinomadura miaoliensis]|uniref:DUF2127 domain-containing protein n=1 Tax=Actinomadura miaoliensis TaxID=430685 RepID=A0ABP7WFI1_9ACTN
MPRSPANGDNARMSAREASPSRKRLVFLAECVFAIALTGGMFLGVWGLVGGIDSGCDYRVDSRGNTVCGVPAEATADFLAAMGGFFLLASFGSVLFVMRAMASWHWWPSFGVAVGALLALSVFGVDGFVNGYTGGFKVMLCVAPVVAVIVPWFARRAGNKAATGNRP